MNSYKHTQIGYLMLVVTFFTILLFIWVKSVVPTEENSIFLTIFMVFIIILLLSFSTLETKVSEKEVGIKFGYGVLSKKFLIDNIASAKAVKNHWYYGWGIRVWFSPFMRIYNISGFDAVEIIMKNGKIYRIGTDAPQELEAEINKYLKK